MTPVRLRTSILTVVAAVAAAACNKDKSEKIDSAAGSVTSSVAAALPAAMTVIDIDMGRHVDSARKISDKTDDFAPKDTIFASVHTSGTQTTTPVVARWTFQDGTQVAEQTGTVTTVGDDYVAFHIEKPKGTGFAKGKYTVHILIDNNEVRTKDVTVK